MIVDIKIYEKTAMFIGEGDEFNMKIDTFAKEAKKLLVVSPENIDGVERRHPNITVIGKSYSNIESIIKEQRPFLTFVSTEQEETDRAISAIVRREGLMVYVPDRNPMSDLNLCAIIDRDPIFIGISTHGLSPAMTVMTKRKLLNAIKKEKIITDEDRKVIRFISTIRDYILHRVQSKRERKLKMYRIAVDPELRKGLESAEDLRISRVNKLLGIEE